MFMNKVIVMGSDGYIGFSLCKSLCFQGISVLGIDNYSRRKLVAEVGGLSVIPILSARQREKLLRENGYDFSFVEGDLTDYLFLHNEIKKFEPDTIFHLGQQPSAPYSMRGVREAVYTQTNNIVSTLNLIHAVQFLNPKISIIKIATAGEWGTPNISIPEGWMEIEYKGKKDTVPFPKQPGSFYHAAKCFDSVNIELACKIWGLNVTNVYQGIVFGTRINPRRFGEDTIFDSLEGSETRFDIDEIFGTAINRFCAQAVINHPITVYGKGEQKRGFLPLRDSVQCLTLLGNNPTKGYRIVNQFAEIYTINQLASIVLEVTKKIGLLVPDKVNFKNPRVEKEEHEYEVERNILKQLGYVPSILLKEEIQNILEDLVEHRELIFSVKESGLLSPKTQWRR